MSAKENFTKRLKELRGNIPVKDLARQTGISQAVLYKAESGEESVSWKTIESGYGELCVGEERYAELLMLWALTQSERMVSIYWAREALTNVIREEAAAMSKEGLATMREMEMMPVPDQRNFAKLAAHYRKSDMTRRMAHIWMENEEILRKKS